MFNLMERGVYSFYAQERSVAINVIWARWIFDYFKTRKFGALKAPDILRGNTCEGPILAPGPRIVKGTNSYGYE